MYWLIPKSCNSERKIIVFHTKKFVKLVERNSSPASRTIEKALKLKLFQGFFFYDSAGTRIDDNIVSYSDIKPNSQIDVTTYCPVRTGDSFEFFWEYF